MHQEHETHDGVSIGTPWSQLPISQYLFSVNIFPILDFNISYA